MKRQMTSDTVRLFTFCFLLLVSCSNPKLDNPFDLQTTLAAPSNLLIEQTSVTSCKLTWTDNATNEHGFRIDRKKDDEAWQMGYAEVAENVTELIEENLEATSTYSYKVCGCADENSTETIEGTIHMEFPAPTNLQIVQTSVTSCKLTWEDNSIGEEGFRIDRKKDNEAWQVGYAEVGANVTDLVEENLEITSTYSYKVFGFADVISTETTEVMINMDFPAPTNLIYTFENVTWPNADVRMNWDYTMAGIDGFKVKKNGTLLDAILPAGTTEWIDYGANIGTGVSYEVAAFFQDTMSAYSNEVSFQISDDLIFVQGGSFEMGDHFNEGSTAELPVHTVTLDNFFIAEHEVTQGEYEAVVGSNPAHSYGVGDDYPVYYVSWYDAVTFCNLKSQQEGLTPCYNLTDWSCDFSANGYRLPTEAEWEYAARGGINWTDDYRYSGCHEESELGDYAWYSSNSSIQTHEVGTKLPNQLGIYDMSGNVWEWCNDWYDANYYSNSPGNNPQGAAASSYRVLRGGSWFNFEGYCRAANRSNFNPGSSNFGPGGFRILRTP
jgi:formylglycine-generating enzyme required for sulfatase activity